MLKDEYRKIAKRKVQQLLEARFRRNLEQVQDYEKGPTYRLTLWYPMVVQLAKATLVRGAPFTIALGMIYLLSFLLIEGCLFAARKPLEEDGCVKAMELLRSWGKLEAVPQVKYPGRRRRGVLLASASADGWQMFNTVIATIANASLFFGCCASTHLSHLPWRLGKDCSFSNRLDSSSKGPGFRGHLRLWLRLSHS